MNEVCIILLGILIVALVVMYLRWKRVKKTFMEYLKKIDEENDKS